MADRNDTGRIVLLYTHAQYWNVSVLGCFSVDKQLCENHSVDAEHF